jgi:polar amino acid transport system substrate-binding protein
LLVLFRRAQVAVITFFIALFAACDLPRDPHRTLEHVRGRVLTVGVSEDEPYIVRHGDEPAGLEANIIRSFAAHLGAQVKWEWKSQERQLEELHKYQLDMVAGGLSAKTPWKKSVAVTRPFLKTLGGETHVFAVPPGENAFLSDLERYLAAHHEEIARAAAGKP